MRSMARGFTLMDLLIVLAIVGILAAIVIPNIEKYREQRAGTVQAESPADCRGVYDHAEYVNRHEGCIFTIAHLADGRTCIVRNRRPVAMIMPRGSFIKVVCPGDNDCRDDTCLIDVLSKPALPAEEPGR